MFADGNAEAEHLESEEEQPEWKIRIAALTNY